MPKKIAIIDSTNFDERFVALKIGVSKAAESYGYSRVTVIDTDTGRKAVAAGGGYDMTGTVFGDWMMLHIQDRLDRLVPGTKTLGDYPRDLYGIRYKGEQRRDAAGEVVYTYDHAHVDGGCGLNSMIDIAKVCGLIVTEVRGPGRNTARSGWMIRDAGGAA